MLRVPSSPRKTLGWLVLVGLIVLFASMGWSTSNAAHAATQHTDHPAAHTQQASSGLEHHHAPTHCNTPLKSGCCACLAAEASKPETGALLPAFPPVPLHQSYASRLIGPAQPPPRSY
ncbi:MAG: hypothetical protein KA194_11945 [Alcaligenes sp.]|nr:hypothetical protein [Alcaligenes sp.]